MARRSTNQGISSEAQPAENRWALTIRHANRSFNPPTDVIELPDRIIVMVEVAGMRAHDLDITLLERHLVISGKRERPQHVNPAYHQVEIGYGEFRIEFDLPWALEREAVNATYEAGFLQVELPRKSPQTIRIVEVNQDP